MNYIDAIIDTVGGLVIAVLGFIVHLYDNRIDTLEKQVSNLPEVYARRDDMNLQFGRILTGLQRIEDKLDGKVDKL